MGLTTCRDCDREISNRAAACPHCGCPVGAGTIATANVHGGGEGLFMKSMNCGCMVVLAIVTLLVLGVLAGSGV